MSIFTTVFAVIVDTGNFLESFLPFLKGKTEHLSMTEAAPIQQKTSQGIQDVLLSAYGRSAVQGQIATITRDRILAWMRSPGAPWGPQNAQLWINYLEQEVGSPGSDDRMFRVVWAFSGWILVNMDKASTVEFRANMKDIFAGGMLFPAIEEAGFDSQKVRASTGAIKEPTAKGAGFLLGGLNITDIVLALLVLGIIVGFARGRIGR